ncbi:MAG: methyl-accepting chemotaxis protein [Emcibacteraceae bacterium]
MNIISVFNNFRVSTKIWSLVGLAISGFIIILVTNIVSNNYEEISRNEARKGTSLELIQSHIEASSLMVRRREKDFFLRLETQYVDKYNQDMSTTIDWLNQAAEVTDQTKVIDAVLTLKDILERHRAQFKKVSGLWQEIGLTTQDGLYAVMQENVHALEEQLATLKNDALTVKMLMMRRHEKDFILRVETKDADGNLSNGPKYVASMLERQNEFKQILSKAKIPAAVKAELVEKLNTYLDAFDQYTTKRMQLVKETALLSNIYAESDAPFEILKVSATEISKAANDSYENVQMLAEITIYSVIGFFGLFCSVVAFLTIRTTVKPIVALESSLKLISGGDYESDVPGTAQKDELGSMARVIADLRDSAKERVILEEKARQDAEEKAEQEKQRLIKEQEEIRQKAALEKEAMEKREAQNQEVEKLISTFDNNIQETLLKLRASSTQMRSTAGEMVEVADSTGTQASSVSDASEKMQENVATMASAIEEFSASIREANQQIQSATRLSEGAVKATEAGTESIEKLSHASKTIENVVNLINDIAEQTNLLALNATIESARAGEAGKGFAVVANEVKSLATQTATATEDIKKHIEEMQSMSSGAVNSISAIKEAITNLNDVMLGISAAIEEQEAATSEISRNVQYTADGTRQVNEKIKQVSVNADMAGSASNDVMGAASELENISEIIAANVEGFLNEVKNIQKRAS